MENNADFWAFILAGTPGLIAVIAQIVALISNRRKRNAETGKVDSEAQKTSAEAAKIQGDAYRDLIDELTERIEKLRGQVGNLEVKFEDELEKRKELEIVVSVLETRQEHYEKYIDMLVKQLREHDIEPAKRPVEIDD